MASLYDDWLDARARLAQDAAPPPASVAPAPVSTHAPAPATDAIGRRLRHGGWTPDRRRAFLQAVAAGATVTDACRAVGLTTASAYALRDRADGAAFALGWAAANLRAREPLADALLTRAVNGQVEWRANAHGERVERFRYDNGLATRMLARLDRDAAADGPVAAAAARIVAGEFDAYLDALGRDEGPARAGLFLAARAGEAAGDLDPVRALARADRFARVGAALPGEVDMADLDLTARADWTADQWRRADAAGLLRADPEQDAEPEAPAPSFGDQEGQLVTDDDQEKPVWWDEDLAEWRTSFPPPSDFVGREEGSWEEGDYSRELSDAEHRAVAVPLLRQQLAELAAAEAERDGWFAAASADLDPPGEVVGEDKWLNSPESAPLVDRDTPPADKPDSAGPLDTASEMVATDGHTLVTPALRPGCACSFSAEQGVAPDHSRYGDPADQAERAAVPPPRVREGGLG